MIVIIPHRDLELKLINAQKKIIKQIFDYDKKIIPYAAMPLWIPTEFETVDEAKNAITKVTVMAPEYDENKEVLFCPVQIETGGGHILKSKLNFIHGLPRHSAPRNDVGDKIFPLPVKIFRLGECTSPKPGVYELSSPVWKKLHYN
ncbi:MAG: hypothetical protein J5687_02845 [Treponema sp.]|nr:hypothetical protein [Treponema sp.]